jgi:hypothetical protein
MRITIQPGDVLDVHIEGYGAVYTLITDTLGARGVEIELVDEINSLIIDHNTLETE